MPKIREPPKVGKGMLAGINFKTTKFHSTSDVILFSHMARPQIENKICRRQTSEEKEFWF
jgi:hypothetical protein